MRTVKAGRLRHWLAFEMLDPNGQTTDSDGAHVETWVPAFVPNHVMPCEVTPISGREFLAAAALQSKVTHRIKVRFREGFAANMRASTERGGLVYNVEAVIPDPDSGIRYLTLLASSGVSLGN